VPPQVFAGGEPHAVGGHAQVGLIGDLRRGADPLEVAHDFGEREVDRVDHGMRSAEFGGGHAEIHQARETLMLPARFGCCAREGIAAVEWRQCGHRRIVGSGSSGGGAGSSHGGDGSGGAIRTVQGVPVI